MILKKTGEINAFTDSGETVLISSYKRVRHEFDLEKGFIEIDDKVRFLVDHYGRRVNCIEKGNYQIIDGRELIDAASDDPGAF